MPMPSKINEICIDILMRELLPVRMHGMLLCHHKLGFKNRENFYSHFDEYLIDVLSYILHTIYHLLHTTDCYAFVLRLEHLLLFQLFNITVLQNVHYYLIEA